MERFVASFRIDLSSLPDDPFFYFIVVFLAVLAVPASLLVYDIITSLVSLVSAWARRSPVERLNLKLKHEYDRAKKKHASLMKRLKENDEHLKKFLIMQGQKKVNRANKLNRGRKSVEGRPILLETPRTLRPVIRNTLFAYERYAKLRGKAIDVSINPEGPEKLIVHFTLLLPDDENQPEKQFKKRLVEGAEDDLWALLKVIQDGRAVTEKDLPVTNRILNKESAQAIRRELDRLNKEIQNIREEMSIYAKERSGLKDLKTQIHEQGQGNFIYINSFEGTLIHSNSDSSFALGDGSIATSLAESTIEGSLQVSSHTIITDIDKLVEMLQATKNSNLEFQQQIVRDIQEIQNDVKNKRAVDRSKAKKAWQKVKQFITDYAEPSLTLLRFAQQIFDVLGKAR